MAPPAPVADFDEGIFLVHLNKGKELLGKGALEQARQELEKARTLRPEEDKVLNLLGMLYFKMEKHTEAREVYARLVQMHPDEAVLHSNLGIIEFKEGRLEEAEKHLQRALQIDAANPRPHQYLGLLYNNRDDLDRAAEHFRKAGMTRMLEKVEQKRHPRAAGDISGRGMERTGADFKVQSPEATRTGPVILPADGSPIPGAPDIDSVIAGLSALTEGPAAIEAPAGTGAAGPAPGAAGSDEADLLDGLLTSLGPSEVAARLPSPAAPSRPAPPAQAALPPPPIAPSFAPAGMGLPEPPPGVGAVAPLDLGAAPLSASRLGAQAFGPFRRPGRGLIELQVSGRVLIRRGSVTHYSGRIDFTRDRQSGLILAQGRGSLFLSDEEQQTLLVELAGHSLSVSSAHLLAVGEGVGAEVSPLRLGTGEADMRALRLSGHGCVALMVRGETLCLDVEPDQPSAADPRLVVAWSGELRVEQHASEILREVMAAGARGLLGVRFEGKGSVLVEQPAAAAPAARA